MPRSAAYQYDENGRLTQVTFSNGSQVTYSYDEMGNRSSVVEVASMCGCEVDVTLGNVYYGDGTDVAALAPGSDGQVLTTHGASAAPTWEDPITMEWQGTWNSATNYVINDVVEFGGSSYIAIADNTDSQPPSSDWELVAQEGQQGIQGEQGEQGSPGEQGPQGDPGDPGMVWQGAWSSITNYVIDDVVSHDGSSYIAVANNIDSQPPSADWALVAQKGEPGQNGSQGPQGPVGPEGPQGPQGPAGGSVTVSSLGRNTQGDFKDNPMVVMLETGELIGWGENTGALANGIIAATSMGPQCVVFDPNTTLPPSNETIVDWILTNANLYVVYSNGWVYSAGRNDFGQLGHGDTTSRAYLSRIEYFVTNEKTIVKVWAAGANATTNGGGCVYFLDDANVLYGCGHNQGGNLGNSSSPTSNISTPAACSGVPTSPHVVDIAIAITSSNFSAYLLFSDGTLKVAGENTKGQLGVGNTSDVTGGFVAATKASTASVDDCAAISANGGDSQANGNALYLDTSGNVWTTGANTNGELGQGDTSNRNRFTQVSALSSITKAELGGGTNGYGYALNASGTLYTWGRNNANSLFRNNTTSPITTPSASGSTPGAVAKAFFPRGGGLGASDGQLFVLTTAGKIAYAGVDNGMIGVDNTATPGAYKYLATPRQIMEGDEEIVEIFVHGTGNTQRLFILTDAGNVYCAGSNADSIATGGLSPSPAPANVVWHKLNFFA